MLHWEHPPPSPPGGAQQSLKFDVQYFKPNTPATVQRIMAGLNNAFLDENVKSIRVVIDIEAPML